MFNISLNENAGAAYLTAFDALKKIFDGECDFKNYRLYVLNLHSALELFFKTKLFEYNDFMIFNFSDQKLMNLYRKAIEANQTLFEYIESTKDEIPSTVSFLDAIKRLAYFLRDDKLSSIYISKLERLNSIRNSIIHFKLKLGDDEFIILNDLFIFCLPYYEYYVGKLNEIDDSIIKRILDNKITIKKAAINDPFNKRLLKILDNYGGIIDCFDYKSLASSIIKEFDFEMNEKDKIIKRIKIFENLEFFECNHYNEKDWDVSWFILSEECRNLLNELA